MKLIVGLGNIGKEYEATRHNIGFMVLDELARRWGVNTWKNDRNALCGEYRIPEKVLLLKPTTYMNLSGVAVGAYANFFNVHDEVGDATIMAVLYFGCSLVFLWGTIYGFFSDNLPHQPFYRYFPESGCLPFDPFVHIPDQTFDSCGV